MPAQFATVAGSVLPLDTSQPLKKAVVTLESRSDTQKSSSYDITDEQGHFSIEKVDPGSYRLVVSAMASLTPNTAREGDLGEFRVFELPPGRYFVSVFYHPGNEWRPVSRFQTPGLRESYLPSFYPNTTDTSKAQPIVIRAGDDIRSLDFFLHCASLVSVSRKVLMSSPTPLTVRWACISIREVPP